MKRNMLRWFEHIERMGSEEFVKKVYVSESVGPNSRRRPPGRLRDRIKEYMCEGGAGWIKQGRSVRTGRHGNFFAVATLGDVAGGSEVPEL